MRKRWRRRQQQPRYCCAHYVGDTGGGRGFLLCKLLKTSISLFSRALLSLFFAAEESDDTMDKDICSERVPKIGPCSLPKYCSLFMRHTKEALIIERRPHSPKPRPDSSLVSRFWLIFRLDLLRKEARGRRGMKMPVKFEVCPFTYIKCQGNYEDCLIGCQVV